MTPKSRLRPLDDRVAIRPIDPPLKSKGGLYIPPNAQARSVRGDVIAVGPGRQEDGRRVLMEVTVGDRVIYGQYSGMLVEGEDGGEDILLIREVDVLAVVEQR